MRASCQQQTVQSGKVDAMGYRLEEMKDLLLQREYRMEIQMAVLNTQMNTLRAMVGGYKPKPTAGSHASGGEDNTYATARVGHKWPRQTRCI